MATEVGEAAAQALSARNEWAALELLSQLDLDRPAAPELFGR